MNPHEEWMIKAEHDLMSAKKLFEEGIYDTAIFHTQQCAEKSLKGYLTIKNHPLQKTHGLVLLKNLCKETDSSFDKILDAAAFLNSRDVRFRILLKKWSHRMKKSCRRLNLLNKHSLLSRSVF